LAGLSSNAVDVTEELVVTVDEATMGYDFEREEFYRGGEVLAYATEDGSKLWSDSVESELSAHVVGDSGAAVGFDGTVVRYGADGEQWRVDLGASPVALAVADGRVYALTETDALVACVDGSERWRIDLEAGEDDERRFGPSVGAGADTVVCSVGGVAVGLAPDGQRRFRQPEANVRELSVVDGSVFAVAGHGLATVDSVTGAWLTEERIGRFAVASDAVYGSFEGELVAYDRSGDKRWSAGSTDRDGGRAVDDTDYMGRVAADADGVFVDSSRGLTALAPGDGSVRWRAQNRILSDGPFLVDDGVLVVEEDDLVCRYRTDTF
jgi:outer membrane protein assembly factor BamB